MVFSYHVTAQMEFSTQELEILAACSYVHYDLECKMASESAGTNYPTQPNGLIVILRNSVLSDKVGRRVMTQREIDLLSKVLEVSKYLPVEPNSETRTGIEQLRERLKDTHHAITAEWMRLHRQTQA